MNATGRHPGERVPEDGDEGRTEVNIEANAGDDRTVIVSGARAPSPDMTATDGVLPPGTRLGEFEILGLIGEGGFGIVYRALDTSLDREVALKEYMPSALASRVGATQVQVKSSRYESMFRAGLKSFINDEARLLARFDHQSLVKVYRFWEANGTAYMVMPYYRGVTLKDALKAMPGPPDEAWLRALLTPLVDALAVLHASNCFHRDIAPDNIILLDDGHRPVLLDFGAARRVIGDMTQALTVILKPGYAPIEQYAEVSSLRQGPWTDHYALAALVYYAITGRTPPPSVGRMVSDSYQPLAKLAAGRYSDRFLRAVDHALAVVPADRPQTDRQFADELGIVLDAASAERGAGVVDGRDPPRAVATARRRVRWVVGAGCVLVAVAGFGWLVPKMMSHGPPAVRVEGPASGTDGRDGTELAADRSASVAETVSEPVVPLQAALPPFTPAGEFARIVSLSDPSVAVRVEVPLERAVVDRDRLRFIVTSDRAGYLYVFAVDPANQYLQLFPNELDRDNRVVAGKRVVLPRAAWPMQAGEPVGENHFLAIVSLAPRDFSALDMAHDSVFGSVSASAQAVAAAQRTLSASPFAGVPSCGSEAPSCPVAYGAATFKIDVVGSSR
ncbi:MULTISPECIES: serine/threonine-protein kinase [unclassified Caballeronia]|uniref:serine/threonine protein kinase n=1 Tax=unclassified Caballeronia TaxID=2646786 RepID=UPI0028592DE5|nr:MULTISPECIES: serine/threonine-protein kinase [unclassified Caballeronia]MDR5740960.1 serine/threonine-protein kinase [Caballeronia sp. LZ016]MDR5806858.1 serine/threonine-protein kinase [Caballeronia sp. LZ019]